MYKYKRTDIQMDMDTELYILKNMPPPPKEKIGILGKICKRKCEGGNLKEKEERGKMKGKFKLKV
jgi:hypothetical protein